MPIQAQDIQKLQQAIEASNIVELRSVLSKLGPGEWLPSCLRKAGVTAHEWKEFHPLEYALWCGKKRITHNAKLYNPALRKDNVEQILILKELMKYSRLSDSQFREQRPTAGYTNSYELLFDLVMRSGIDDLYVQAHHDSGAHAEFFKDECLTWQFLTICLPKKFKASDLDYSRGFAANFKYVSGLGSGLIRLASQASISLEQFNKILNDHFDSSLVDRCARTWLELQPIPMTELGVQKSLALLKKMFGNMKKTSGSEFIFDRIPPSITQLLHKVIKATEAESRQDVMNELRAAFDGVRLLPSEIDSLNNIFLLMRAELSLQISNIVSPSARQPQQQFAPVPVVQMHMAPIMQPVPQPQPAVLPAGGNALPQNQEAILNDELGSLIKFVFPIVLFGSMGKKLKGVYESETPPDRVKEIIRHFCKQRISDERKLNSYLDRFMRDFGNPAIAHWVEQYGGAIPPLFLNRALTQPQVELVRTIKQDLFLKYLKKHTELLLQACYLECEDSSHPEWEMKVMTHYLVGKSTTLPSSYKFCDKKDDQFVRRRKQEFSDKNPHALPIVKMLDLSSHRFISTPLMREDYRNKLGLPALGGGISHVDFFYHMFQYTHLMLSQSEFLELLTGYIEMRTNNCPAFFYEQRACRLGHAELVGTAGAAFAKHGELMKENQTLAQWSVWLDHGEEEVRSHPGTEGTNVRDCLVSQAIVFFIEQVGKSAPREQLQALMAFIANNKGEIDMQELGKTALSEAWIKENREIFLQLVGLNAHIVTAAMLIVGSKAKDKDALENMIECVRSSGDRNLCARIYIQLAEAQTNMFSAVIDKFLITLIRSIDVNFVMPSTMTGVGYVTPLMSVLLNPNQSSNTVSLLLMAGAKHNFEVRDEFGAMKSISMENAILQCPFLDETKKKERLVEISPFSPSTMLFNSYQNQAMLITQLSDQIVQLSADFAEWRSQEERSHVIREGSMSSSSHLVGNTRKRNAGPSLFVGPPSKRPTPNVSVSPLNDDLVGLGSPKHNRWDDDSHSDPDGDNNVNKSHACNEEEESSPLVRNLF